MRTALLVSCLAILTVPQNALAGDCPDATGDGSVDVADLLAVLADWGPCPGCGADVDGSGVVDVADLLAVLAGWGDDCGMGTWTSTQLVGHSLGAYPWFEFPLAFHVGEDAEVAIDPTRFPTLAGTMADVYVVTARTADEWNTDPTLVDATPTGPVTFTFSTGSITDNIVPLPEVADLSGDAGTDLGVPYDVVVDANRNGVLDDGDLIDGYGDGGDTDPHGMYMVRDPAQPGPLLPIESPTYSVGQVFGIVATRTREEVYYPSNIAVLGELPLIVVAHGNGHDYRWYDHIGNHMASWGYVVMSLQNNTGPGIEAASQTILGHTDAFLSQLATIQGGVLNGHVDSSRIAWIGHSRGGEGVTRAYQRLLDGNYVPTHYAIEDLLLISSIAPTDYYGADVSDIHAATYHLWVGGADSDVNGCCEIDNRQSFHHLHRGDQWRQSISLHGAGHGDFHDGGGSSWAAGPCLIGRTNTHTIMRGYFLPLCELYLDGGIAARDYLWRQWERFRPPSAPTSSCVVVDTTYREGPGAGHDVLDDYQTETDATVSSSGGAVTYTVVGVYEGRLDDGDTSFTHTVSDAMNGMTVGGTTDDTRGVVFQWNDDAWYEQEVVPTMRDFTDHEALMFQACQGTRHPNTIAELGDLTFTVTLRDEDGTTSSIQIGAYGGGIEEPYQRTRCGTGVGWGNEFETIRIRLTDFTHDRPDLDLAAIEAIRFEFGPSFGSEVGRIGMDQIALSRLGARPQ